MNFVQIARNNFNSWNRHDAEAIAAAYGVEGIYITPSVPEPLKGGTAIGEFAKVVWTIFPARHKGIEDSANANKRSSVSSPGTPKT